MPTIGLNSCAAAVILQNKRHKYNSLFVILFFLEYFDALHLYCIWCCCSLYPFILKHFLSFSYRTNVKVLSHQIELTKKERKKLNSVPTWMPLSASLSLLCVTLPHFFNHFPNFCLANTHLTVHTHKHTHAQPHWRRFYQQFHRDNKNEIKAVMGGNGANLACAYSHTHTRTHRRLHTHTHTH